MRTQLLIFFCLCTALAFGQDRQSGDRFRQLDRDGDGKLSRQELPARRMFDRADTNRDGFLTREEIGASFRKRRNAFPQSPTRSSDSPSSVEMVRHLDQRYAESPTVSANLQSLDVYTTPDAKARPVFLFVHGGSWKKGDKSRSGFLAERLVERGYVFASANYRLLPEARFPQNAEDVAAAVAWLHRHATDFGGDPKRLFLAGHSAGAHLAALVGADARYLAKHGLKLDVLRGTLALDTLMYDVVHYAQNPTGRARSVDVFGEGEERWRLASPALQARAGTGIAPVAIAYSGGMSGNRSAERREQAERFATALRKAGARAVVIGAPEKTHGQIALEFAQPDDKVAEQTFAFWENRPTTQEMSTRPTEPAAFTWKSSLVFGAASADGSPLPVNAMNLTAHKGMLFCGMATSFERDRYSRASSYIYVKKSTDASWELDADFGPGTSRVGAMLSARFVNDATGRPIPKGPVEVLLAFTMRLRRGVLPSTLQARIRDDSSGKWLTVDLPTPQAPQPNVRVLCLHRDTVTGADLLFVGASPSPLGILTGSYDGTSPGGIRWRSTPELTAQGRRGTSKWFGMATVNGALYASDVDAVFRRIDGPQPRRVQVLQFPRGVGDVGGAEVRGLTAVPNPPQLTGWPEPEMLLLATQMKLWRMRCPSSSDAPHPHEAELDMIPWLSQRLAEPIVFAEAAFNPLRALRPSPGEPTQWPIGFQIVYSVPGKKLSYRDPASYRLKDDAWFLLRDANANYTLDRITSDARLFLARDFQPSPFPVESSVLYACGFNGSYFKGSLGSAWIYRGSRRSMDGAKRFQARPLTE